MPLSKKEKVPACKYCGGNKVIRFGSYKGTQRYFCKLCGRKFKDDNHLFHMKTSADYVAYVLESYYTGVKIADIRDLMQQDYGYRPSATLMRLWIEKNTARAYEMVQNHRPLAGDTWVLNEMILMLHKKRLWIYEIVDEQTNYLLAYLVSLHGKVLIKTLIQRAVAVTGKEPQIILVYMPPARFREIKSGIGYKFEHVPKEAYADCHRIGISGNARLYDTGIYRLKNPHGLRTPGTAGRFMLGLSVHHNYFTPDKDHRGRTPADAARISYPYHSWRELVAQSSVRDQVFR